MVPIMRRLMVIVLILWLPLQAWSAVFAAGCTGHGSAQQRAAVDTALHGPQDHARTAMAGAASDPAQAGMAHSPGNAHAAGNAACADGIDCCVTACVVLPDAMATTAAAGTPPAAPARHGDEAFSSALAGKVLEPPIASA